MLYISFLFKPVSFDNLTKPPFAFAATDKAERKLALGIFVRLEL